MNETTYMGRLAIRPHCGLLGMYSSKARRDVVI